MAHYEAYIARYGDRDFNEMPFNEVDGLIFSQLAYVDYAGIVGGADAQFQTLLDDAAGTAAEWIINGKDATDQSNELTVLYNANASAVSQAITNATVANIVVTISWNA